MTRRDRVPPSELGPRARPASDDKSACSETEFGNYNGPGIQSDTWSAAVTAYFKTDLFDRSNVAGADAVGRKLVDDGRELVDVGRELDHDGRDLADVGRDLDHDGRELVDVGRELDHEPTDRRRGSP